MSILVARLGSSGRFPLKCLSWSRVNRSIPSLLKAGHHVDDIKSQKHPVLQSERTDRQRQGGNAQVPFDRALTLMPVSTYASTTSSATLPGRNLPTFLTLDHARRGVIAHAPGPLDPSQHSVSSTLFDI